MFLSTNRTDPPLLSTSRFFFPHPPPSVTFFPARSKHDRFNLSLLAAKKQDLPLSSGQFHFSSTYAIRSLYPTLEFSWLFREGIFAGSGFQLSFSPSRVLPGFPERRGRVRHSMPSPLEDKFPPLLSDTLAEMPSVLFSFGRVFAGGTPLGCLAPQMTSPSNQFPPVYLGVIAFPS